MRISTFLYIIAQGIKNIFRNKWFSLASVATISACLFLFGLIFSVVINFQSIVKSIEEEVAITVFFEPNTSDLKIAEIGEKIKIQKGVVETNFVSAEEAWNEFKQDLNEYAEGYPENPLANSMHYEIYVEDVSMQAGLVAYLESIEEVRSVRWSEVATSTLTGVNLLIAYVSIGMVIILLAVSIFLISNTVTIGISVRKEEINIMKYVGATDIFVRAPFVVEGICIGFIGAIFPLLIVYVIYTNIVSFIYEKFPMLLSLLNFIPVDEIFNHLIPISFGIGIGIGFVGSFTTVRKHLRV